MACHADDSVTWSAAVQSRIDARGQRDQESDHDADQRKGHCGGQPLEQCCGHRFAVAEADPPEITCQRRAGVGEELCDQRAIETAGRPQGLVGLRCVPGAQCDAHRVAGHQVQQREHHDKHTEHHHSRIQQPAQKERDHAAPPLVRWAERNLTAPSRRASYPARLVDHA